MIAPKSILFGFILFSLTACMKLPIYHAQNKTDQSQLDKAMQGYDKDNEISWAVHQDLDYFELHLRTEDKTSMLKILNSGMTIYLDPTGKKKKNISVQFPLEKDEKAINTRDQRSSSILRKQNGIQKLVNNLNPTFIFENQGELSNLNSTNTNEGIEVQVYLENESSLHYKLRVSKKEFLTANTSIENSFSLGIFSNGQSNLKGPNLMETSNNRRPNNSITRNPRGQNSRMGNPSGRSRQMRPDLERLALPINIWFKVTL